MGKFSFIYLFLLLSLMSCSDDSTRKSNTIPLTLIAQCDRTYEETSRVVMSTNKKPGVLSYNLSTGAVSVDAGEDSTNKYNVQFSMDKTRFFEFCVPGSNGVKTSACPYYIECISKVKYNNQNSQGDVPYLNFKQASEFIRSENINSGPLFPSMVEKHSGSEFTQITNIVNACDVVSRTYSSSIVAATIFENIPEVPNYKVAQSLGKKAVKGYGECRCVLANYIDMKENMSIGKCKGEKFVSY